MIEHSLVTETPNISQRIDWIDSLKGFAIFCVTMGHFNMWAPIERYIYSFHMFLFFFLSGFLFSAKLPQKEMIKKRIKRLLVPFLAWNTVSSFIGFLFEKDTLNLLEELFVLNGNLMWNAPIWFLLVLFISELFCILCKLYKQTWISITTIIISLGLWILIGDKWLLWKLNLVPMALSFFLMGYLFKTKISLVRKWIVLLPLGVGSIIFSSLNIRVVYTTGEFGNYFYCIMAAFCGVLFFVALFSGIKQFSRRSLLIFWGKNSLLIMALQSFVFQVIFIISIKYLGIDLMNYQSSVVSIALTLFTMFSISVLIVIIKKLTKNIHFLRTIGEAFGVQY